MGNLSHDDVAKAHQFCTNNKPALMRDRVCGCFFCLNIFSPREIENWVEDSVDTAICPYCDVDSVIGESSGYPITKEFLTRMYRRYFESGVGPYMHTPFGEIKVLLDGAPMVFQNICIDPDERYFPNVDQTHRIAIDIEPDGKKHTLEFVLTDCEVEGEPETGERLEAVSFYPGNGKITLGCYASFGDYKDYDFDFDGILKKDGIEISIFPTTATKQFFFGVSWVTRCTKEKDIQTWFGADPFCDKPWPD